MKAIRVLLLVAVISALAGVSAVALAKPRPHADLRVPRATVHRTTRSGHIVVTGSFRVTNAGSAAAPHFHSWLGLSTRGRTEVLRRYSGRALRAGHFVTLNLAATLPATTALKGHNWTLAACTMLGTGQAEHPLKDGCRTLMTLDEGTAPTKVPAPTPSTSTVSTPTPTPTTTTTAPPTPVDTFPTSPLHDYSTNQPYFVADGRGQYEGQANTVATPTNTSATPDYDYYSGGLFTSGYWAVVPPSYDQSNQTPETLVVWMHGCGGVAAWDAQDLTGQFNTDRPYILISINGPEGANGSPDCWDTGDQTDVSQVLADIANAETHFNIDRRRIVLAGYSSGGDLAYQTIFLHATTFAGILATNTDPVRDNTFGNSISTAIADAAWKFNILHVAHSSDTTYPIGPVTANLQALQNAGFPATLEAVPGTHYDDDLPDGCNDSTPGTCSSGTAYDIVHDLLDSPMWASWQAPAS